MVNKMQTESKAKLNARIIGILFICTTIAGIFSVLFFGTSLQSPVDLAKIADNALQVRIGALFYFSMAISGASIAISMYPILKKYNEGLALGAASFRLIEGITYIFGVMSILTLVTLSQEAPSVDSYYNVLGELLLAGQNLNQTLIPGVFAFSLGALIYNYIFYQERLIPRWLSVWGLVAAILVFVSGLLNLIGGSSFLEIAELLNFPTFIGEMVLALWLIVKGFN